MQRSSLLLAFAAAVAVVALSCALPTVAGKKVDGCGGSQPNQYPVYDKAPMLIRQCKNGKLFIAGNANENQTFYVLHVWGTPAEQGRAYGTLLAREIAENYQNFFTYLEHMIEHAVKWLPAWLVDLVVQNGAPYLLELTYNATRRYTPDAYIEEIDAIAEAANFSKWALRGLSQLPEAIEAQCTIIGAQGAATPDSQLAHARFLDFGSATIKNLPMLVIYHNNGAIADEANFGWVGFTGMLTGAARVKGTNTMMSLGEKVWDAGNMWTAGIFGEAWTFVTRDMMRNSRSIGDVVRILSEAHRTCRIWLGVGHQASAQASQFRLFAVDQKVFDVYTGSNFSEWPAHPTLPNVTYVDKHMQPSNNPCLGNLLREGMGKLNAEYLATTVASFEQSGDIHAATFDDLNQIAYFSIMKKSFDTGAAPENAYDRQWTKLDMRALWAEQPPTGF